MIRVKQWNEGMGQANPNIEQKSVEAAVKVLAECKEAEEAIAERKETAQMVLANFHFETGARSFEVDGVGAVTTYLGSSTRFDKTKMALYLVEKGVLSELVEAAMKAASEIKWNDKVTVKFSKAK